MTSSSQKASMKVPARRRGNTELVFRWKRNGKRLNESPRPKAGKCLNDDYAVPGALASMKVPARRRGNPGGSTQRFMNFSGLNESPRPKAGKWCEVALSPQVKPASMKVPARRRGKATRNWPAIMRQKRVLCENLAAGLHKKYTQVAI